MTAFQIYEKGAEKKCVLKFEWKTCKVLYDVSFRRQAVRCFCCSYRESSVVKYGAELVLRSKVNAVSSTGI